MGGFANCRPLTGTSLTSGTSTCMRYVVFLKRFMPMPTGTRHLISNPLACICVNPDSRRDLPYLVWLTNEALAKFLSRDPGGDRKITLIPWPWLAPRST